MRWAHLFCKLLMGRLAAAPCQLLAERETHGAEWFSAPFPPVLPDGGRGQPHASSPPEPLGCCITGRTEEGKPRSRLCAEAGLCSAAAKKALTGVVPTLAASLETDHPGLSPGPMSLELQTPPPCLTLPVGCSCQLCSAGYKPAPISTGHFVSSPSCSFYSICVSVYRSFKKLFSLTLMGNERYSSIREGGKQGKTNSILSYCFCICLAADQISSSDACCST